MKTTKTFFVLSLLCYLTLYKLEIIAQESQIGFYYVSGSGQHGIYLAQRNLNGSWNRGSKLLLNSQFDGNAVDPDVIKLDDGRYRIFYYKGYFVTQPPPNSTNHEIYSAVSADGINYSVEGKVFESDNITDPSVVRLNDGSYLMVCVRGNVDILAKSSDGKVFQTNGSVIQNGGIPELVKLDNGNVRLFYNGAGGIVSSLSVDGGATWVKEPGVRLSYSKGVADPSVIKVAQNKWYMFVKGFNNTGAQNPAGHKVMISESSDCYTFNFINGDLLDSASVPEGVVLNNSTDINRNNSKEIISTYQLYQNYPNPFNPETTISYYLPRNEFVTLKVYNVLGQEVRTLVNEYQKAGSYSSSFNTLNSSLTSGLYFYRLNVNSMLLTKKMVLVR